MGIRCRYYRHITGQGYYDYATSCGTCKDPRIRRVEYALRMQGIEMLGTRQNKARPIYKEYLMQLKVLSPS